MNSRNEELIQAILDGETLTSFTPKSRTEAYLKACVNKTGVENLPTPQSRMDALLLALADVIEQGDVPAKCNIAQIVDKSITTITAAELAGAIKIGDYAFYNQKNLKSIEIPSSVTKICNRSFAYCTALASITIPTNVIEIEGYSFRYCDALVNVTIEAANITIRSEAFNIGTETNKATIKMLATTPPLIEANSFNLNTLDKIIVPAGCGSAYKSATNWTAYADYIVEATIE